MPLISSGDRLSLSSGPRDSSGDEIDRLALSFRELSNASSVSFASWRRWTTAARAPGKRFPTCAPPHLDGGYLEMLLIRRFGCRRRNASTSRSPIANATPRQAGLSHSNGVSWKPWTRSPTAKCYSLPRIGPDVVQNSLSAQKNRGSAWMQDSTPDCRRCSAASACSSACGKI